MNQSSISPSASSLKRFNMHHARQGHGKGRDTFSDVSYEKKKMAGHERLKMGVIVYQSSSKHPLLLAKLYKHSTPIISGGGS